MLPISPSLRVFLHLAWFYAAIGYLAVALVILQPTNWFGAAHCAWAAICVFGTWQMLKAAKRREAESREKRS